MKCRQFIFHAINREQYATGRRENPAAGSCHEREIAETRNQGRVTGTLTVAQCRHFSVGILLESFRTADTFRSKTNTAKSFPFDMKRTN